MTATRCPCPRPPGGAVICEGRQFAYCHVIGGEVHSGCIPNPVDSALRPHRNGIAQLFDKVLIAGGFEDWRGPRISYSIVIDSVPPWDLVPGPDDRAGLLEMAMLYGVAISLKLQARREPEELLIRFPGIWSRYDASPDGMATMG